MRLLLDTHVALWALTDHKNLSAEARALLLNTENDVYFSAASVWEIAIKHALARRDMPLSGDEARVLVLEAGYKELAITSEHAAATESLPYHHADPFDRILLAQSKSEPMRLMTHDRQLLSYGDFVQWV